jgi:putative CocE/NonD family hydrolase
MPLRDADQLVVGSKVTFYQDWLEHHQPGARFWEEIDYSRRLDAVSAPVNLVAGWYDLFLPSQLADYQALRTAGKEPYLTVGPWNHVSLGQFWVGLKESLAWFDAHLRGHTASLRALPVRIFVMGSKRWLELPDWPPPAIPTRWHLHPNDGLSPEPPVESLPDSYRYDPSNPTPALGGIVLGSHAGPKDNRILESRPDVLTYTSAPLPNDLEVIGPVTAELHVQSSLEHTDFFVRLCDVEPGGRSVNVCDGLVRLSPGRFERAQDGVSCIRVDLWPTAYCFLRGHRVRLQVSSGAHPRYSRNPGSGEPLGSATTFKIADQHVYHDPGHRSVLILPVHTV